MKKRLMCFALLITIVFAPTAGFAHSGRTDSSGGHYNRKTGEYHYHNKKKNTTSKPKSSAPKKEVKPTSKITLTNMPKEMIAGEEVALQWTSENTTGVKWKSSNTKRLIVTEDGKLLAVSPGKVKVTAKMDNKSETFTVTVKPKKVEGIRIVAPETAFGGEKILVSAEITPEDATDQRITWKLNPKSAGKISSNGTLTLNKVKERTEISIVATSKDGGFTAEHQLTILPNE